MKWIDVRDQLPYWSGLDVLAYTEYGCLVAHYDGGWLTENDEPIVWEITHWMELPDEPKPENTVKPQPPQTARTCGTCKNWEHGSCNLPRSPRFTDTTSATDGCTPNKKARADWI